MQSTLTRPQTNSSPADTAGKPVRSLNIGYDEKLDHLRFLAAFIIIVFHSFPPMFSVLKQIPCDWNVVAKNLESLSGLWLIPKAFVAEGHTAVGLFLTISGFLFARITSNSDIITSKFYLNRLLRIYPLYLCFILMALCLNPGPNPIQGFLLSVLTFQNLPNSASHPILTPHLWSVAVEFQIYLIFPVILAEYRSKGIRSLLLFLSVALGLKLMVYLLAGNVYSLAYESTFGRIDQFLIGAMLGYTFSNYRDKIRHPVFCFLALALVCFTISTFHMHGGSLHTARKSIWIIWPALEASVWGAFLAAYCSSSLQLPGIFSRALSFLGGISYSLYVTHFAVSAIVIHRVCGPVYNLNKQWLQPIFGNGAQECFAVAVLTGALCVLPATVLMSCLTYYGIEKPFMNRRVKYTIKRSPEQHST